MEVECAPCLRARPQNLCFSQPIPPSAAALHTGGKSIGCFILGTKLHCNYSSSCSILLYLYTSLKKSTPLPVVAMMTNMSYVCLLYPSGRKGILRKCKCTYSGFGQKIESDEEKAGGWGGVWGGRHMAGGSTPST